jgi:hypothetical protein
MKDTEVKLRNIKMKLSEIAEGNYGRASCNINLKDSEVDFAINNINNWADMYGFDASFYRTGLSDCAIVIRPKSKSISDNRKSINAKSKAIDFIKTSYFVFQAVAIALVFLDRISVPLCVTLSCGAAAIFILSNGIIKSGIKKSKLEFSTRLHRENRAIMRECNNYQTTAFPMRD